MVFFDFFEALIGCCQHYVTESVVADMTDLSVVPSLSKDALSQRSARVLLAGHNALQVSCGLCRPFGGKFYQFQIIFALQLEVTANLCSNK